MAPSDQDREKPSRQERLEEIKREEREDPGAYYAQGDAKEDHDEEAEFAMPIPKVEKEQEEMSLLKAVAYLGFGLAALSIVFILFFIRDLDNRVVGVDSAVSNLEETIAPLRKEVKDSLSKVNEDITVLKTKMNDSERRQAVMELKRALVAVQGMGLAADPDMQIKSDQVVASIQSLLSEFGVGETQPGAARPAPGVVEVEEAPPIELPVVEESVQEPAPAAGEAPAVTPGEEGPPPEEPVAKTEPVPEIEELTKESAGDKKVEKGEEESAKDDEDEDDKDEDDEDEDDEDEDEEDKDEKKEKGA